MMNRLIQENPWIPTFEGFSMASFGMPRHGAVEDELGIVIGVETEAQIEPLKKEMRAKLGSSRRWNHYPIYFEVVGKIELL